MEISFDQYFSGEKFSEIFNNKLKNKAGGGRDRLTPSQFISQKGDQLSVYADLCKEFKYKFSPYNENLILKGRGKFPRVIAIPTVRDRLVLAALNAYLSDFLGSSFKQIPANKLVRNIQDITRNKPFGELHFIKLDFSNFFCSINRALLVQLVREFGVDERAVQLIESAINNPTKSDSSNILYSVEDYGIPQGLAISNVLINLYLKKFDEYCHARYHTYLRYVDDIIILNDSIETVEEDLKTIIETEKYNLVFNSEKTQRGILLKDELDFLGYRIVCGNSGYGCLTSVRKTSVTKFLNKIAKECTLFRRQYNNKQIRPKYLKEDDVFVKASLRRINISISGIRYEGRYFGWIQHFQQIDDIDLLSMIDRIIRRRFLKFLSEDQKKKLLSLRRTYYMIIEGKISDSVVDYDSFDSIEKKYDYLNEIGLINRDRIYSTEELEYLFEKSIDYYRHKMEAHIGHLS